MIIAVFVFALHSVTSSSNFFVISDLHYDIAYESDYDSTYLCHKVGLHNYDLNPVPTSEIQSLARNKCDSSLSLIESALSKMTQINPNPEFIIMTGDLIAHFTMDLLKEDGTYDYNYNKQLLYLSHTQISELLRKYFPNTQIIPSIGNNDGYSDYVIPSDSERMEYYTFLHNLWIPLCKNISPSFFDGGYYSTSTQNGYRFINLNSNLFSIRVTGAEVQANGQLKWLEEELRSAEDLDEKVIISMHIPPGVSTFRLNYDWHEDYITQFLALLKKHQLVINSILAGHFHTTTFQLLEDLDLHIVVHPAISPIYSNNPGFRYYTVSQNSQDYSDFFLNLTDQPSDWRKEYSFQDVFNMNTFDYKKVYDILKEDLNQLFQYLLMGRGLSDTFYQKKITKEFVWEVTTGLKVTTSTELARLYAICCMKYVRNSQVNDCVKDLILWDDSIQLAPLFI